MPSSKKTRAKSKRKAESDPGKNRKKIESKRRRSEGDKNKVKVNKKEFEKLKLRKLRKLEETKKMLIKEITDINTDSIGDPLVDENIRNIQLKNNLNTVIRELENLKEILEEILDVRGHQELNMDSELYYELRN
tara:strand:+ start:388 stop:789 length:402 start_codon:yes stop_codon:yes gene_type:complete